MALYKFCIIIIIIIIKQFKIELFSIQFNRWHSC